eukprot:2724533-Rhodomonas_salina.4
MHAVPLARALKTILSFWPLFCTVPCCAPLISGPGLVQTQLPDAGPTKRIAAELLAQLCQHGPGNLEVDSSHVLAVLPEGLDLTWKSVYAGRRTR